MRLVVSYHRLATSSDPSFYTVAMYATSAASITPRVHRLWRRALAWQIALAVYMQAISWIPLGRWNFQPCCPTGLAQLQHGRLDVAEALVLLAFLIPVAIFAVAGRYRWRWVACLSLAAYMVWLALQLWTWWPPYIVGASDGWARVYARAFAEATQVLPRRGNHLPPDAMHLVLQVLLIGVVIAGTRAIRQRFFSPIASR